MAKNLEGADLQGTIEMAGTIMGVVAGFAVIAQFYSLESRFHQFVGIVFLQMALKALYNIILKIFLLHQAK